MKIAGSVWIAAAVLAAAGPRPVGAEVARSMTALEARLEPGVEVDVVDSEGRVYRGDFARADGDGVLLTLAGNAGRRIPAAEVVSVSRKGDSLKNGMLIGGGIGALSSLIVFAADDEYDGYNEYGDDCDSSGCKVGVAIGVTAFYVGVGALVDHLIKGRELVYRAPPEGVALSVAPYPVRQGAGVRVALRF